MVDSASAIDSLCRPGAARRTVATIDATPTPERAPANRRYTDDVPEAVEQRLRELCAPLPDAYEQRAWVGTRWMIRKRTFAHVLGIEFDNEGSAVPLRANGRTRSASAPHLRAVTVLAFRSAGEELEMLRHAGYPFFELGWGRAAMGMVLDADTDWEEVAELVTESFCVMAPKRLAALVERPRETSDEE